jgi:DNA-binding transcriptional ArsR family regulator
MTREIIMRMNEHGDLLQFIADLGPAKIKVLRLILKQIGRGNDIWPSNLQNRQRISNMLGIGDPTLRQYLRELEQAGILSRPRGIKRGAYKVELSKLNIIIR